MTEHNAQLLVDFLQLFSQRLRLNPSVEKERIDSTGDFDECVIVQQAQKTWQRVDGELEGQHCGDLRDSRVIAQRAIFLEELLMHLTSLLDEHQKQ